MNSINLTRMTVDVIYSDKRREELEESRVADCRLVQDLSERVLLASGATDMKSYLGRNYPNSKGDITIEVSFPFHIKSSQIESRLKKAGDYAIRRVIATIH
jgi:hypothetical protein